MSSKYRDRNMGREDEKNLRPDLKAQIIELRRQLTELSEAVQAIKKSGFNIDLLALAIQQSAKRFHTGTPINLKHIRFILQGIGDMDAYLKDPKGWES